VALTLNQAAKTCRRSKSTLLEAIRSGRMTAPKDDRGRYAIDPSELHRVFPFNTHDQSANQFQELTPTSFENQPEPADPGLRREVELLREMLAKAETNADHWRTLAERQQALLEYNKPKKPRSFFQRLLGT
jgi:hypothetical protein